jgi:hypothetical protein
MTRPPKELAHLARQRPVIMLTQVLEHLSVVRVTSAQAQVNLDMATRQGMVLRSKVRLVINQVLTLVLNMAPVIPRSTELLEAVKTQLALTSRT